MKVNLVHIGNSRGVRIPASVIRQCGFGDKIEMRIENGVVVLAPAGRRREDWAAAFEKMAAAGDDALLTPDDLGTSFDDEEWTW